MSNPSRSSQSYRGHRSHPYGSRDAAGPNRTRPTDDRRLDEGLGFRESRRDDRNPSRSNQSYHGYHPHPYTSQGAMGYARGRTPPTDDRRVHESRSYREREQDYRSYDRRSPRYENSQDRGARRDDESSARYPRRGYSDSQQRETVVNYGPSSAERSIRSDPHPQRHEKQKPGSVSRDHPAREESNPPSEESEEERLKTKEVRSVLLEGGLTAEDFEMLLKNCPGRMQFLRGEWYYCLNSTRDFDYPLGWAEEVVARDRNLFSLPGQMFAHRHQRANFLRSLYPYLPFIPIRPSYENSTFYILKDVPPPEKMEETSDGKFMLNAALAKRWEHLEAIMRLLVSHLAARADSASGVILPRSAADLGYKRPHKTREIAHRQAVAARNWFSVWMGALSYFLLKSNLISSPIGLPVWDELVEKIGNEGWLREIWTSPITEFGPENPRTGVFLHCDRSIKEFKVIINDYLYWGIPVLIHWDGTLENQSTKLGSYGPPFELLRAIKNGMRLNLSRQEPAPLYEIVDRPLWVAERNEDIVIDPKATKGDVPRLTRAESFIQCYHRFWDMRRRSQEQIPESEEDIRDIQEREREASQGFYIDSASFFEWMCDDLGKWHRISVPFADVAELMLTVGSRYDGRSDEWDFAREFGTPADSDDKDMDEDRHDLEDMDVDKAAETDNPTAEYDTPQGIVEPKRHRKNGDLVLCMAEIALLSKDRSELHWMTVEEYAKRLHRHNQRVALKDPKQIPEQDLTTESPLLENMRNQMGFLYDPAVKFFDKLPENWEKDVKIAFQPFEKYRMVDDNLNVAIWRFGESLGREIIPGECDLAIQHPHWESKLQFVRGYGKMYGLVAPPANNGTQPAYELVFHSAAALLFALRLPVADIDNLIGMLTRSCIHFNTAREFDHDHRGTQQMAPELEPPTYMSDYKFTSDDMVLYHARVETFIRGPRGRAALTSGGLVGRIARGVLSWSERITKVQCGPSSDVVYRRNNCLYKKLNGKYIYDDVLTTEEKQLILGVFKVRNVATNDITRQSLWPGPHEIESKHLMEYCWYWSEQNEMKYLRRKAELEGPNPQLLTVREWKGKLRGGMKRIRVVETVEKNAQAYLDEFLRKQQV